MKMSYVVCDQSPNADLQSLSKSQTAWKAQRTIKKTNVAVANKIANAIDVKSTPTLNEDIKLGRRIRGAIIFTAEDPECGTRLRIHQRSPKTMTPRKSVLLGMYRVIFPGR